MPPSDRGAGRRNGTRRRSRGVAGLVAQFALSGLAALAVVGLVSVLVLRHQGVSESIRDARQVTGLIARGVIEPNLSDGVVRGDPAALRRLDRLVRARVIDGSVVRVKLWTPSGKIVYSDERRLIGSVYPLRQDERNALATGKVDAELSDLRRPENRFERPQHKLLEVYLPIRTQSGRPLLFEAYLRYSSVAASARKVWRLFAPALLAALVLLWLLQVPLAGSLARRLRRHQEEREALLLQAIDASDAERRRIAADLHDGVVQDLAGISFSLAAAADRISTTRPTELGALLRHAAAGTRESMRRLRSLLVEIYPPNLQSAGVGAALGDLLAPLRARGIDVSLDVEPIELEPGTEQLVFRTAQEALRNVAEHADAAHVDVTLRSENGAAVLTVRDDGRGFADDELERRRAEGHLGLALLADRAQDAGGDLTIDSARGEGTSVRLEVPRA